MAVTELQGRWKYLYSEYLPSLAAAKDPVQPKWPVHLDHCFARIILDNTIGVDKPWTEVIKGPAIKNMTVEQFQKANALAEKIANGEVELVELDEKSLALRGKQSKTGTKRKADQVNGDVKNESTAKKKNTGTISSYFNSSPRSKKQRSSNQDSTETERSDEESKVKSYEDPNMSLQVKRIQNADITAFRKQMLMLLCQIPRGRYSTYQAMADHVTQTSHKSCARAVGNAMKNNPFAPEVPCHRVLASDGTLGGFKGSWGEEGKYAGHKHQLLAEEGVKFDSRGKVKGPPFRDFRG